MSIFKRGRHYWFEFVFDGKRIRKSTKQGDKEAAKKMAAKERTRLAMGEVGLEVKPKETKLTIADLLNALEADFKMRGKWTVRNQSTFRGARNDFGARDARTVSAQQVDAYIEKRLAAGARPATVNRTTELVRQAYRFAVKRGELHRIPAIRHLSEKNNVRQGFFTVEEFEAVVTNLPDDLQDFCRFGFLTGWRKNEIASLRWSDVEDGTIRLRGENSKNREPRQIVIEGELIDLVERRREDRSVKRGDTIALSEYVFHRDGEPVQEFRKSWASACVAAGLGKMVCPKCESEGADRWCGRCKTDTQYRGRISHDFRRTAVRNMVRSGIPQSVAMKISGHKTASMFRRYDISNEDDLRQAMINLKKYHEAERKKVVSVT